MIEKVSLSGEKWSLREISESEFYSKEIKSDKGAWNDGKIYPAKVPGNVQLDLIQAGVIPNPFFGKSNEQCQWVSDKCWAYRTSLKIPSSMRSKNIFLRFKRTDYVARFFLNGRFLGRHVGMFSPSIFKINDYMKSDSEDQELIVLLKGSPKNRNRALKCQMSYGWDFAMRAVTIGIWDEVELFSTIGGRIVDCFVYSEISKIEGSKGKQVKLILELELELYDSTDQVAIKVSIPELGVEKNLQEKAQKGSFKSKVIIPLEAVELWYPNSAGNQKLYDIKVELLNLRSQQVMDKFENIKFGFRKIKMRYNPKTPKGNEKWTFVVNNRPEFVRGANWVPPDSFFGRIDRNAYDSLIKLAKDVHLNMFRLWGGGICEKESFYELCDERGIMLWQEFPFACANYPNDPAYLKLVEKECSSYVRQIRNHPSVAAYVGGNEWSPTFNAHLVNTLKKCCSLDPTRIYYDVSPCKGDLHNWSVWHAFQDFGAYKVGRKQKINLYQFFSEFGVQALPNKETMEEIMPKEKLWPISDHWKNHNVQLGKLKRYGECVCAFKDLKSTIYATQIAQAEGIKVAVEYVRKSKPEMSGVLFWQWNEPWPTISWTVIDYFRRPKIAYEYLKEIYNPILPIVDYKLINNGNSVVFNAYATNDLHDSFENCKLKVDLLLNKNLLETYSKEFELTRETTVKVNNIFLQWDLKRKLSLPEKVKLNIKARIFDKTGKILSENNYYPFRYRERLITNGLHELLTAITKLGHEKFYWAYELNQYLGIGQI